LKPRSRGIAPLFYGRASSIGRHQQRIKQEDGKLGRFAMAAPVRLRDDYTADDVRKVAKQAKDAAQTRRLLALAAIYDGASRGEAARIGGVGVQTVRDWVLAFNAEGPLGLIDGKAPGQTPKLTAEQRQALKEIVEEGPTPAVHGVVRWRLVDLVQWVWDEYPCLIRCRCLPNNDARP